MRPFPIYPLYTQAEILSLDKPIADCFLFRPRKNRKSAGNAVIPTYPTHCSHGLQYLRYKRPMFAFMRESGYTLGSRRKIAHSGSHGETGDVSDGGAIITLDTNRTFTNIPGPGVRTANFAAFGSWPGVRSRRTQRACGAAMRLCASLLRGVAAPLGCVIFFYFCQNCDFYALRTQGLSACARHGWYHYPRRALHAAEMPDGRLSKRFICRFLASPIYICESSRRALPISASIQIACRSISCGQTACP